jgi:hypothetical protein
VQARFDKNPDAMRTRRETVEHPFGTLKMRMGCHALLDEDATEGCHRDGVAVLAYTLTRVLNIFGVKPIMAAVRA